jgi:hypothetical protein
MAQTEFREFLLFLFHRTKFWLFSLTRRIQNVIPRVPSIFVPGNGILSCFLFAEGFGMDFWEFSVLRNSWNSVGYTPLFRLFRLPWNYFLSEIPDPSSDPSWYPSEEVRTVFGMSAYTLSDETCKSRSPHPQLEYGQAPMGLGLRRRPVNVFSALGSEPGVYSPQHEEKDCHPHYTME